MTDSSSLSPPLDPSLFDLDPGVLWIMHCAEGPVPRASVETAQKVLAAELRPWTVSLSEWLGAPERVKSAAAALLGGTAADWSITASTSDGLTAVAQAIPWREGDEIVVPLGEFPSNYWPWAALAGRGVSVREVPLWAGHQAGRAALASSPPPPDVDPEGALLGALGPRTRLLSVSWVRFQDGLRLDLARLAGGCAAAGVDLVIDGIQGAGALPLDLGALGGGVVGFATGVHKGLLAPQGAGLLFTTPGFRARTGPVGSWLSVEGGSDFSRANTDFERAWLTDGRRFERGSHGNLMLEPLAATLSLLAKVPTGAIASHVGRLQTALLEGLAGSSAWSAEAHRLRGLHAAGRLGPILALHHQGRGAAYLQTWLQAGAARGILATTREGYLRVALHGFHEQSVIPRLLAWLTAAT